MSGKGSREGRRFRNSRWRAKRAKARQDQKDQENHLRKTHHVKEQDALIERDNLQETDDYHILDVYPCPICGLYLVGHRRFLNIGGDDK